MTCAALLASMFPGVAMADLDRSIVYEVPAAVVAKLSWPKRRLGQACAAGYQIKYRVVG